MSWAVWITGRPGSGKSTIARAAAAELAATDDPVQVLELDVLRRDAHAGAHGRRGGARGRPPGARRHRPRARAGRPSRHHRRDRASPCLARSRARVHRQFRGGAAGVSARGRARARCRRRLRGGRGAQSSRSTPRRRSSGGPPPAWPRSRGRSLDLRRRRRWPVAGRSGSAGAPGSGKTTVVSAVCERLAVRGARLAVLEVQEFTALIAACALPSREQREIVARAVVLAAALLRDAGYHVIIDGAAPVPEGERLAAREHRCLRSGGARVSGRRVPDARTRGAVASSCRVRVAPSQ